MILSYCDCLRCFILSRRRSGLGQLGVLAPSPRCSYRAWQHSYSESIWVWHFSSLYEFLVRQAIYDNEYDCPCIIMYRDYLGWHTAVSHVSKRMLNFRGLYRCSYSSWMARRRVVDVLLEIALPFIRSIRLADCLFS